MALAIFSQRRTLQNRFSAATFCRRTLMKPPRSIALLFAFLAAAAAAAVSAPRDAQPNPELLQRDWDALWVEHPDTEPHAYGVYYFRKSFDLAAVPNSFVVNVSADNRYQLFVNGKLVNLGPARGDFYHWKFDTLELAPFLRAGPNTLAAIVWNDGDYRPEAQISFRTAFLLQGNGPKERVVNTDPTWRCLRSDAYAPLPEIGYSAYYVSGPGEDMNMARYPSGWDRSAFDDSHWAPARQIFSWMGMGQPKGSRNGTAWMLIPRGIPLLDMRPTRYASARTSEGVTPSAGFVSGAEPLVVPPHTQATLLLDQGELVNALSELAFSGGRGAVIELAYAEALFENDPAAGKPTKGHRDEVEDKWFAGRRDRILSSGAENQRYLSLAWRTYRYTQVNIRSQEQPLQIESIGGIAIGYPFRPAASFNAEGLTEMNDVLAVGRRTAQLCALETYMDCPYYEQLQYIGDTRIQALVSYYEFGDDRLARSALEQMDQSRLAEGLTLSRHPSGTPQIIPTFSLWYVGMLHDYWRYRRDPDFVASKLEGTRGILSFFSQHQSSDGTLRRPPYWLFTDWVSAPGWDFGEAPFGEEGESAAVDLQLLWALQLAAELEANLGRPAYADDYAQRADQLAQAILARYWDESEELFRDTFGREGTLSQHVNALALLTGLKQGESARQLAASLLQRKDLAPASIYFRYYLHQALIKSGLGDDYWNWLDPWREHLAMGLTTWAEISDVRNSRSDCHAWGSSPNIEAYRTILGIDSAAPGFARVRIEPRLGDRNKAAGSIPHPLGTIAVEYEKRGAAWSAMIHLPDTVEGEFVWEGKTLALKSGINRLEF